MSSDFFLAYLVLSELTGLPVAEPEVFSPLFLMSVFTGHGILFFYLTTLKFTFRCLLSFIVANEKSVSVNF